MQLTIETFIERKNEIDLYFSAIKQLYESKDNMDENYVDYEKDFHKDEFLKILKSNILLMIYNLIESSVMGGILEIYNELKTQHLSYQAVSDEIKNIWFSSIFDQVYDKTAHFNSYRNKANEIITSILSNETIILDRNATGISGNLSAEEIRKICSSHGIYFCTPAGCRGGLVLEDVKDKRNQLAHGTLSFVECGRNYTVDDLEKIKNETNIFLNSLLINMKQYYDEQRYKIAT